MSIRGSSESNFNITRDEYVAFYTEHDGFDTEFSENARDVNAPLGEIMLQGGRSLVKNNRSLVEALWT